MAQDSRRRNILIVLVIVAVAVILLLLFRCQGKPPQPPAPKANATPPASTGATGPAAAVTREPDEVLTPATLAVPAQVAAGSAVAVRWTGPDNRGDYVTIVRKDSANEALGDYRETKQGGSLEIAAPMEPGACEVRYITGRSHTILGRAPVEVVPVGATLDAAAEVTLGAPFPVTWTGPNNKGDYITIVAKGALGCAVRQLREHGSGFAGEADCAARGRAMASCGTSRARAGRCWRGGRSGLPRRRSRCSRRPKRSPGRPSR